MFNSPRGGSRKASRGADNTAHPDDGPASSPAVVADNLTFAYPGSGDPSVAGVSFTVAGGEFVYLVGASGSGKSTLLRMLYAELAPTSGRLQVDGVSVGRLRPARRAAYRRHLGVVFQDFKLLDGRTVFEQVSFALTVVGRRPEAATRVPAVLDLVGLTGKEDRLPTELSGGEQQRVAIARALVTNPSILIADEPTGNLDPVTSATVMEVLDRVNATGVAIVMATHDVSLVNATGHRVLVMEGGHLVRDAAEGGYAPVASSEHHAPPTGSPGPTFVPAGDIAVATGGHVPASAALAVAPLPSRTGEDGAGTGTGVGAAVLTAGRRRATPAGDEEPGTEHAIYSGRRRAGGGS